MGLRWQVRLEAGEGPNHVCFRTRSPKALKYADITLGTPGDSQKTRTPVVLLGDGARGRPAQLPQVSHLWLVHGPQ